MTIGIDIGIESISWNPLAFILVIILTGIVSYILYSMGNSAYKKTKHKGEPFISGNRGPDDVGKIHVGGDNLFWGFTRALRRYFDPVVKGHTGIVNDYIYWIVITMSVVLVYIYLAV